ncbi:3-oxoadipate enol-lactonase [Aquisalimonas asiatica]|uniref:3-oxoadipate enol-lactonase n=1 Tax=Aquisalimonas asiatica TaxID=406100 RepID=A0A1H8UA06_9GAMM|nr:3-oxoadipate enol-lactonase [Aquisalimonas asiatica]SEO99926.1 3-oxoadipate enol-lactonase [Aquisalimonas asiatica]
MQFLEHDNGVIHYTLEGPADAPVVMFANSLGTDLRMWDAVAERLRGRYRLLRYDMRGHGLTSVPDGPYTIAGLAEDCVALMDGLGLDRVHFCGLSIGGMVGQQLAGSHGERLHSVILCDTTMRMPEPAMWAERAAQVRADGLDGLVDGAMERWFTPAFLGSTPVAGIRNMFLRTPPEGYAGCCEAIGSMDLEPQVDAIDVPTLVVVGENDPGTPVAASEAIVARIAGAGLEIIPAAAHLPPVEQPEATVAALTRFLDAR